jgi:hypothetical protein
VIRIERRADGSFEAVAEVVVGVDARQVRVPLGPSIERFDAAGLRGSPVVVLTSEAIVPLVEAGAARSGRATVGTVDASPDRLGAAFLEAASTAEVLLVRIAPEDAGGALVTARALAGRPLPVVPFDRPHTARTMLASCWVDLDIAIPSIEGHREEARELARDLDLFSRHHVIEVDPRPGLDPLSEQDVGLLELAASATGVLAGRIAAGDRRWR